MPPFRIEHPFEAGASAEYGVGPDGAFVIVQYAGLTIEALEPGDDQCRPILAVLETLVAWWFFGPDDVAETLSLLARGTPVPRGLRRVAEVIENVRGLTG